MRNDRTRMVAGESRPPEWIGTVALGLVTIVSIAGFGIFALHPELLPADPFAIRVYQYSFRYFAQAHVVTAFAAIALLLSVQVGWRWLPAFLLVYFTSFAAEHVGTGWGLPFGTYGYSDLLGPKLLGRVPAVIPASWFVMAFASFRIADAAGSGPTRRVLLGAALLTAWDLALDPAMSSLTPYWRWESGGPYYGMPWLNLAGWMATGIFLMAILEATTGRWRKRIPMRGAITIYALVFALPVGMLAAAGETLAVGASAAGLGLVVAMVAASGASASEGTG